MFTQEWNVVPWFVCFEQKENKFSGSQEAGDSGQGEQNGIGSPGSEPAWTLRSVLDGPCGRNTRARLIYSCFWNSSFGQSKGKQQGVLGRFLKYQKKLQYQKWFCYNTKIFCEKSSLVISPKKKFFTFYIFHNDLEEWSAVDVTVAGAVVLLATPSLYLYRLMDHSLTSEDQPTPAPFFLRALYLHSSLERQGVNPHRSSPYGKHPRTNMSWCTGAPAPGTSSGRAPWHPFLAGTRLPPVGSKCQLPSEGSCTFSKVA